MPSEDAVYGWTYETVKSFLKHLANQNKTDWKLRIGDCKGQKEKTVEISPT